MPAIPNTNYSYELDELDESILEKKSLISPVKGKSFDGEELFVQFVEFV